jgi:hypothetical protein
MQYLTICWVRKILLNEKCNNVHEEVIDPKRGESLFALNLIQLF